MDAASRSQQPRHYLLLRARMCECGLNSYTLARGTGVSAQHINNILGGRTFPRIDLCYEILSLLDVEPNELPYYFPPNGKTLEREISRTADALPREMVLRLNGEVTITIKSNRSD